MKPALNEIPLPKYIAIEGPIGVKGRVSDNKLIKIHFLKTSTEILVNKH